MVLQYKKKICILTSAHPIFDVRVFHREAKTLVKAGYNVTLIAQHNKNEIVDGIKIIGLPKPKNRFFRIFETTWKIYKLAKKQKTDVYHFHDPELLLQGALLRFFTKKPVIYDAHEDFLDAIKIRHWVPLVFRELLARVIDIYEKIFALFVNYIITADDNIKKRFFLTSNKKITIFNFPKIEYFKESSKKRNPYLIIHPGGLTKERGGDIMIDAIKQVKQEFPLIKFISIGNVYPHYEKHIRNKIQKYKLTRNIFLFKMMPQRDIIQYLRKASIGLSLLQPIEKFRKNIPQKIFEYMASGVPFIISNLSTTRSFVKECKCAIIVDSTSAFQVAEAIIYLLTHPDEARRMGENGKRVIFEKYNWENESKKLLRVYEELFAA